jgi:hypothetical protein
MQFILGRCKLHGKGSESSQVGLLSVLIVFLDINQCYAVGLYMSDLPAKLSSDLFVFDSKIHCIRSSNTVNLCLVVFWTKEQRCMEKI